MSLVDYDPATPEPWRQLAACRGMNTAIFFQDEQGGPSFADGTPSARSVCARCPVRRECFEEATFSRFEKWGVWGGASEAERRKVRKAWKRTRSSNVVRLFDPDADA